MVATGCTRSAWVGLPAAYSIARWRQRRLALTCWSRIIPGISYLIPWYIFFRHLKLVDTHAALILTHLIGLPIIIWVMIGFFEDVPPDLEDAALIDGCSYLGVFWRWRCRWSARGGRHGDPVVRLLVEQLPVLGDPRRPPDADLPIAVFNMISYEEINWGTLAAAATMITLPRACWADRPAPHRDRAHLRRGKAVGGPTTSEAVEGLTAPKAAAVLAG